jgi:alpha-tubulin suppressor-like RCC1 family protein
MRGSQRLRLIAAAALLVVCGTGCTTTWSWGTNDRGQLADGTTTPRATPGPIADARIRAVAVDGGVYHTCALLVSREIWCAGGNFEGQLGDGTTTDRPRGVIVAPGKKWTSFSAGYSHVCAIDDDRRTWCWGSNFTGELGDGTTTNRSTPAPVAGPADWTMVSAGVGYTCGIHASGTMSCWGRDDYGQIGDGLPDRDNHLTPTAVARGDNWRSVNAGYNHACGTRDTGALWCWGDNGSGQSGEPRLWKRSVPTRVGDRSDWLEVSAGGGHTCALRTDRSLWCWGANHSGQLGNGTFSNGDVANPVPAEVVTGGTWRTVSSGGYHSCAIRTDGTLWCWGANQDGAVGDGTGVDRARPTRIGDADDWHAVTASWFLSTVAVRSAATP